MSAPTRAAVVSAACIAEKAATSSKGLNVSVSTRKTIPPMIPASRPAARSRSPNVGSNPLAHAHFVLEEACTFGMVR